jgi:hypothetical protein
LKAQCKYSLFNGRILFFPLKKIPEQYDNVFMKEFINKENDMKIKTLIGIMTIATIAFPVAQAQDTKINDHLMLNDVIFDGDAGNPEILPKRSVWKSSSKEKKKFGQKIQYYQNTKGETKEHISVSISENTRKLTRVSKYLDGGKKNIHFGGKTSTVWDSDASTFEIRDGKIVSKTNCYSMKPSLFTIKGKDIKSPIGKHVCYTVTKAICEKLAKIDDLQEKQLECLSLNAKLTSIFDSGAYRRTESDNLKHIRDINKKIKKINFSPMHTVAKKKDMAASIMFNSNVAQISIDCVNLDEAFVDALDMSTIGEDTKQMDCSQFSKGSKRRNCKKFNKEVKRRVKMK